MKSKKSISFECDFCDCNKYRERKEIKKKFGMNGDKYEIVECVKCHLVSLFPHPMQEEILDLYKNYDSKKDRFKYESIRRKKVYPDKLTKLKKYAKGPRLLDIGAGLGTFAFMATQEGFDVTAIELSHEQCKRAKNEYGMDLLNHNIFDIKNDIGRFDIVHLHHVMEHLTSPSRMFDIIEKLLKDNGILLIEVPYQLNRIQDPFKKLKTIGSILNFEHMFFFSPKTMKNYVKMKGFEIIEFNQYRSEQFQGNVFSFFKYSVRYVFRKVTTFLWIPSGSIIELYCRKQKKITI